MADYRDLALLKAKEHGLDPNFVSSLINQESRWNPLATSPVGARGLMQIMPATGRGLGIADPEQLYNPEISIDAGTRYLSQLDKQFGGNQQLMAMAYNAGPGRVSGLRKRYGESPEDIFPHLPAETQNYVRKVTGPMGPPTQDTLSREIGSLVGGAQPLSERERVMGILGNNANKNFVQRILHPDQFPSIENPDGSYSTHKMAWGTVGDKAIVFPTIQMDQGKLREYGDDALEHALTTGDYISFDSPKDADWFSQRYKAAWEKPPPRAELRTAPAESMREQLYNLLFSSLNEDLPEAKTWPGPELGLPPKPPITTGTLAMLGMGGMSGMGAVAPALARALPTGVVPRLPQLARGIASSMAGSALGGRVGEELGGETGRDIGAAVGDVVGIPGVSKLPGMAKSDLWSIPPRGPLKGTAVLTREGLAKPMAHGAPVAYESMDMTKIKDPNALLFGPGHYFTSAGENVASGYAGETWTQLEKQVAPRRQLYEQAAKKFKISEVKFEQALPADAQAKFRFLKQEAAANEAGAPPDYDTHPTIELSGGRRIGPPYRYTELHQFINDWANPAGPGPHDPQLKTLANQVLSRKKNKNEHELNLMRKTNMQEAFPKPPAANVRPVYLNIKNPFPIDKVLQPDHLEQLGKTMETYWTPNQRGLHKINKYGGDLWKSAQEMRANPDKIYTATGQGVYEYIESLLGDKQKVKEVLEAAGFDGITHLGDPNVPRLRGGPHSPQPHRVYIAFRDDQVVPYFNPKLTPLQEKAKAAALKRRIKDYKQQNAALKGKTVTTELPPQTFTPIRTRGPEYR